MLYLFITIAIRIMGKRQIGDMQPNELVITLLISEIAAIPLQDSNQPVLNGVAAISVLVILEITVSLLVMKSTFLRKIMNGSSIVIIKNGKIDINQMKRVRMTVIDLVEMLRSKDIFNIEDVAYAILEVNGEISVLPKSQTVPPSAKDLSVKTEKESLPLPIISDGKIIKETVKFLNLDQKAIKNKLTGEHKKIKDVFLMTADQNGNMKVIEEENR